MYLLLAGIIARYSNSRVYGSITINRLVPWGEFLGYMAETIDEGGDTHELKSVVTSIIWSNGQTVLKAGFAS